MSEQGGDHKIRIFGPTRELPFAGHPTVGTAFVLADARDATLRLEEQVGTLQVTVRDGFTEMEQPLPTFEQVADRNAVAASVSLDAADLEPALPIDRDRLKVEADLSEAEPPHDNVRRLDIDQCAVGCVGQLRAADSDEPCDIVARWSDQPDSRPGQFRKPAFVIPGGVAHELEVLEDRHIIDVFSPPREEFS